MSNLVIVSQSNVSLPLLLPYLMATLSCQWVTHHLWLAAVCFCTLGIIHITPVHWKNWGKKYLAFPLETLLKKRRWTLHAAFFVRMWRPIRQTRSIHPGFVCLVWISVFLHDVLWIIPVSLIRYLVPSWSSDSGWSNLRTKHCSVVLELTRLHH